MKIQVRAHHTSFAVRDVERSKAFYGGVLGLEEIPRPNFPFPGAWYQAGACQVHLIQIDDDFDAGRPPPALNPMANHAAFAIDDYGATREHLAAHGLEVLEAGEERGQMWTKDPDGHIIELIVARPS
jgi:glyoxylase I family protein